LFIPLITVEDVSVALVAEQLIENGTREDPVLFAGTVNVQLLKVLSSAPFHKWATRA
jgi:hypothetical protein